MSAGKNRERGGERVTSSVTMLLGWEKFNRLETST
jgi:hypothetical protein